MLRCTMSDLEYPEQGPVMDREAIVRLDDLEKAVQTFRGLNMLRAAGESTNRCGLDRNELRQAVNGQLWQIVYFALRLFDYAYPGSAKTPHRCFARTRTAEQAAKLEEVQLALAIAVDEDKPDTQEIIRLAEAMLDLL